MDPLGVQNSRNDWQLGCKWLLGMGALLGRKEEDFESAFKTRVSLEKIYLEVLGKSWSQKSSWTFKGEAL